MSHAKKYLALFIALLVPFAFVSSAQATGESVAATTTLTPNGGKFYKEAQVSSKLKIDGVVTPAPGAVTMNSLKNLKISFPAGMGFKPNSNICPDSKLNENSNLAVGPMAIKNLCPKAVVGTGTAVIYLARVVNNPATKLTDPVLVAFNAGKNNQGQPMLKIYGYSKATGVGILMEAALKNQVLDIAVPVLTSDSAVGELHLDFPGSVTIPDQGTIKGQDPNYVQAKCGTGSLVTNATFVLGQRDYATKQPIPGTEETIVAPTTNQSCTGLAGKAKLGGLKVKGPGAVKNGRKGTYKVTVKNTGTATAKNVVVTSSRGGKGKGGNIAPGKSKTIAVKTTIRGKKGRKVAVKFTAKSGNVKAAVTKKVRVK